MFERFRKKPPATPVVPPLPPATPVVPPLPPGPFKGRILVVDDDAVIRKALGLKLSAAGYEMLFAGDGAEAVAVARREKLNVIILDLNFPAEPGVAWDGFKLLRWLHRSPEGLQTPIIIITDGDSPRNREKAMEAGAVGFFQKPVDMASLLAAINGLVAG